MMRTGGGWDFITRIWTELVWVRRSSGAGVPPAFVPPAVPAGGFLPETSGGTPGGAGGGGGGLPASLRPPARPGCFWLARPLGRDAGGDSGGRGRLPH